MKCKAHRSNGEPCRNDAMTGITVCRVHGGRTPGGQRKHIVAKQLARWGLTDATDDPVQTLLRLITQTRQRCDYYADLLQQQVGSYVPVEDETRASDDDIHGPLTGLRIPREVAGLIGFKYAAAGKDGDIYASDEGVRALVGLEQSERRLLADLCKAAITAGLSERMVQLAEAQGALIVQAMQLALSRAEARGLDAELARLVLGELPAALREIEAQAKTSG